MKINNKLEQRSLEILEQSKLITSNIDKYGAYDIGQCYYELGSA